jgi:hypothetical protein
VSTRLGHSACSSQSFAGTTLFISINTILRNPEVEAYSLNLDNTNSVNPNALKSDSLLIGNLLILGGEHLFQLLQLLRAHRINLLGQGVPGSRVHRHQLQNHKPEQIYGHLDIVVLGVVPPILDSEVEVDHVVLEHRHVQLWALELVSKT